MTIGSFIVRRSSSFTPSSCGATLTRSGEHTSELQSLMRISYAVFCLKKTKMYTAIYTDTVTHQTSQLLKSMCTGTTSLNYLMYTHTFLIFSLLVSPKWYTLILLLFFFNDTATTEIYTY